MSRLKRIGPNTDLWYTTTKILSTFPLSFNQSFTQVQIMHIAHTSHAPSTSNHTGRTPANRAGDSRYRGAFDFHQVEILSPCLSHQSPFLEPFLNAQLDISGGREGGGWKRKKVVWSMKVDG